jgi:ankyrin repeat protein
MINDVSSTGESALFYAILSGSLETVVALLEAGADLNEIANKGMNVFHHAAVRDHSEILEVLAVHPDAEKVIDLRDKYGRSALDVAQVCDKVLSVIASCCMCLGYYR